MFIPELWCGVAATLIAETLALMGAVILVRSRMQKRKLRTCGSCPLASDEVCLTDPPMKCCSITNEYHFFDHKCNVQEVDKHAQTLGE